MALASVLLGSSLGSTTPEARTPEGTPDGTPEEPRRRRTPAPPVILHFFASLLQEPVSSIRARLRRVFLQTMDVGAPHSDPHSSKRTVRPRAIVACGHGELCYLQLSSCGSRSRRKRSRLVDFQASHIYSQHFNANLHCSRSRHFADKLLAADTAHSSSPSVVGTASVAVPVPTACLVHCCSICSHYHFRNCRFRLLPHCFAYLHSRHRKDVQNPHCYPEKGFHCRYWLHARWMPARLANFHCHWRDCHCLRNCHFQLVNRLLLSPQLRSARCVRGCGCCCGCSLHP